MTKFKLLGYDVKDARVGRFLPFAKPAMEGHLSAHPLAEILRELIAEAWTGVLRLAQERVRMALYFERGELIHAASNLKHYRLAELLQRSGQLTAQQLNVAHGLQTHDLKLAQALIAQETVPRAGIEATLNWQASELVKLALKWPDGEWQLEPRVRPAEALHLNVPLTSLLVEAARKTPDEIIKKRLQAETDEFSPLPYDLYNAPLRPIEAFLLTRLETKTTLDVLLSSSGVPEAEACRALYVLSLGGFIKRTGGSSALAPPVVATSPPANQGEAAPEPPPDDEKRAKRELDSFLARMEFAQDFYQMLGVERDVSGAEIKASYHKAARKFHPDLFRGAEKSLHKRIETEFTKLTRAYEMLKDPTKRAGYDAKLPPENQPASPPPLPPAPPPRSEVKPPSLTPPVVPPKPLIVPPKPPVLPPRPPVVSPQPAVAAFNVPRPAALSGKRPVAPFLARNDTPPAPDLTPKPATPPAKIEVTPQQAQWADNSFRRGVTALATRDYISAIACLGEAVRLNPKEGRYHAYFGRALSCDPGARRQAEIEFIAAIRLEPENLSYPIMLAEFYWNMNFPLRAQGELRRVLQKDPFNQEATALRNKIEAALLKK